jgi:hypothetical protein
VIDEIQQGGFQFQSESNILKENYFLRFLKVDRAKDSEQREINRD